MLNQFYLIKHSVYQFSKANHPQINSNAPQAPQARRAHWVTFTLIAAGISATYATQSLLPSLSQAAAPSLPVFSNQVTTEWKNPDPNSTLKRVISRTSDYSVKIGDSLSLGKRMDIGFETDTVSHLTDYVVVQFLRGCSFTSRYHLETKTTEAVFDVSHYSWSAIEPFKHADWIVDSVDKDPVYNSSDDEGLARHFAYRSQPKIGGFEKSQGEKYFGVSAPVSPWIYVVDRPGTVFVGDAGEDAKNISLEFQTCVYKNSEVPNHLSSAQAVGEIKSVPLYCTTWASSFIYNFETKKFERPQGISPLCGF